MARNIVFNYGDDDLIKRAQALAQANRMQAQKDEKQTKEIRAATVLTETQRAEQGVRDAFRNKVVAEFNRARRWINYDDSGAKFTIGRLFAYLPTYSGGDTEPPERNGSGYLSVWSGNGQVRYTQDIPGWYSAGDFIPAEWFLNPGPGRMFANIITTGQAGEVGAQHFVLPIEKDACIFLFLYDHWVTYQAVSQNSGSSVSEVPDFAREIFVSRFVRGQYAFYIDSETVRPVPVPPYISERPTGILQEGVGEAPYGPGGQLFPISFERYVYPTNAIIPKLFYSGSFDTRTRYGDGFYLQADAAAEFPSFKVFSPTEIYTPASYFVFRPEVRPGGSFEIDYNPNSADYDEPYFIQAGLAASLGAKPIKFLGIRDTKEGYSNFPGEPVPVGHVHQVSPEAYLWMGSPPARQSNAIALAKPITNAAWRKVKITAPPRIPYPYDTSPAPQNPAGTVNYDFLSNFPMLFWDWGQPEFCRARLFELGFRPQDLTKTGT